MFPKCNNYKIFFVPLLAALFLSCNGGGTVDLVTTDHASLSLAPQENIYVAAAMFTDPLGSIATVQMNDPNAVRTSLAATESSDVILKSFNGKLYVINRGLTSTIQVINPETMKIEGNYSVGASSNPQDIVVVGTGADAKAYITRYDPQLDAENGDDLWIVDPLTGKLRQSIDLKPLTDDDGERLARAMKMALVGNSLYVLVQDLSKNYKATTNGKVAVIDTTKDEIVATIPLKGRNPTSLAVAAGSNQILITDTGVFDEAFNNNVNDDYGGVEVIDTTTNTSKGIVLDDKDFNGSLATIVLGPNNLGVLVVGAKTVATFDATSFKIIEKELYSSASGFIPELLLDKNVLLWIPERDANNSGVILFDPKAKTQLKGPFAVGALPVSMTLIR